MQSEALKAPDRDDAERLEWVGHLGRVVVEELAVAQAKVTPLPGRDPPPLFVEMALRTEATGCDEMHWDAMRCIGMR
jgi:hypothetical protein